MATQEMEAQPLPWSEAAPQPSVPASEPLHRSVGQLPSTSCVYTQESCYL